MTPSALDRLPGAGSVADETPVFLRSGQDWLFAVHTSAREPRGLGVVCLHAGVNGNTAHRGQVWVHLARRLAPLGVDTLRLDMAGSGDSTGVLERRGDGQPARDVQVAAAWLRQRGIERLVLTGTCFGARLALSVAPSVKGAVGISLLTLPMPQLSPAPGESAWRALHSARSLVSAPTLRRLRRQPEYRAWLLQRAGRRIGAAARRAQWLLQRRGLARGAWGAPPSSPVSQLLASAHQRGLRIQLMYGTGDVSYPRFQRARVAGLAGMLEAAAVELQVFPGRLHGLPETANQERMLDELVRWVASTERATAGRPV